MSTQTPLMSAFLRALLLAPVSVVVLVIASHSEIRSAQCRLIRYGDVTQIETFPCDFRQAFGNVQVWSSRWKFNFTAREQGETYIRINRIPLTFTRTGQYTLEVAQ